MSDRAPKIECAVRNVSDDGAHLQVPSGTFGIPDEFDLTVASGDRHRCHVIWRTENKIGVKFK